MLIHLYVESANFNLWANRWHVLTSTCDGKRKSLCAWISLRIRSAFKISKWFCLLHPLNGLKVFHLSSTFHHHSVHESISAGSIHSLSYSVDGFDFFHLSVLISRMLSSIRECCRLDRPCGSSAFYVYQCEPDNILLKNDKYINSH